MPADTPVSPAWPHLDGAVAALRAHRRAWIGVEPEQRVAILDELRRDVLHVADRWVAVSLAAKGATRGTLAEAEEWLFFAVVVRALRLLHRSLSEIHRHRRPRLRGPVTQRPDGQVVVRVIPHDPWDRLLFRGTTAEVWMEPGLTRADVRAAQARTYREPQVQHAGTVTFVLGAGNASMLPVIDLLHKLFVEDHVVLLKPNPVNAYLGPLIEEAFAALIRRNFLRVVYGGAAEGAYLARHPAVDALHLTGSARTFEAITFGESAATHQPAPLATHRESEARLRRTRTPVTAKRFTCELGNISPVIIVPGPWNAADLREQAEQIATWLVANAGFGCLTPRVLVQHRSWPLRDRFLDALGTVLAGVPTRRAYYPGAGDVHRAFLDAHPDARRFGARGGDTRGHLRGMGDHLPWTVVHDVDPANTQDVAFRREAFCGLLAETALAGADAAEFLDQAVAFANHTLWGSLNATLIVHPASARVPRVAAAIERAVAELRYGTVLINTAAFAAYYFQLAPWGGFPGHDAQDIQSGVGKTANLLMLERPQKSVVRGPFRRWPDPIRVASRHAPTFARHLAHFEASPAPGRAVRLAWAALRP